MIQLGLMMATGLGGKITMKQEERGTVWEKLDRDVGKL